MRSPSAEQYERWYLRDCARCGRHAGKAANWSDGPMCRTCLDKATRTRGRCPGCGTDRLLPGRRPDGTPICRDCAGITRNFFCDRCGFEGRLHTGRLCERCTLADKVTATLDDGTGRINPALAPLAEALIAMPDPWKGWMWLRTAHVQDLLTGLARGRIPLTHQALHQLPGWRTVAYLRDLLMACGVLPATDKQLLHTETWLTHRLAELDGHAHEPLLRRFATWHLLPTLRARAARQPLTASARQSAGEQFTHAQAFLTWLDEHDLDLRQCGQADLDSWHATHPKSHRAALKAFLTWAMANRHMRRLDLPVPPHGNSAPLSQRRRLELIRRAATDDQIPPRVRVTACLVLLYAQPITRIMRLTLDDISITDTEVRLRLDNPPSPVPEPFATLLLQLAEARTNMNTAANPDARWLFPGQNAREPLNAATIREQLRLLGFSSGAAREAALRQLVLQAPAPVVAEMLGYTPQATTRHAAAAGSPWSRYAAGDHTK
ncbi:hypothetical protein [Nonomuraea sp. NEAU-A123]|uniref:hypothetical protein n=1 Tax=Nonomuraea sp. NEAU-A123 TaxID=2839649 RepID=UPI001BE45293|nr:hypothetical protein [Nonomuraea sp. NEAU-A123]MBT2233560.1 hypothetical protein [Nonomuraea sp. NEAU-A123]